MAETWWRAEGAREVLGPLADASVADWIALATGQGEVLSRDRSSAAVRLHEAGLLVKWRRPRRGRRWRTWLRRSREACEAGASVAARARGIPAIPPLAVGEARAGGILLRSVLVRPFREDLVPASSLPPERLEGDLAGALRRWHDLGLRHGDCWPRNVLVDPAGGPAVPIGMPRARFVQPGARLDGRRLADLTRWAIALADRPDPFAFLAAYVTEAPGLPPPAEIARRLPPRIARLQQRRGRT